MTTSEAEIRIRPIRPSDDAGLAAIIRTVMSEFEAIGAGFSIEDPEVDSMSQAYAAEDSVYLVAEVGGRLVGGSGIGRLADADGEVCELRKMYLLPEARGLGVGKRLLEASLNAARERGYRTCYLETLGHMDRARRLYESFGFRPLDAPLGNTGHFGCNRWYAMPL